MVAFIVNALDHSRDVVTLVTACGADQLWEIVRGTAQVYSGTRVSDGAGNDLITPELQQLARGGASEAMTILRQPTCAARRLFCC